MTGSVKGRFVTAILIALSLFLWLSPAAATTVPFPDLNISVGGTESPSEIADSLKILFLLTVLSLAPAIMVMMTSFSRVIIVLSFTRNALATQQIPPNQLLIGLALFITFFIMAPVWGQINQDALQPYLAGTIGETEAFGRAAEPLREFMLRQTREKDLALFVNMSQQPPPAGPEDITLVTLIPAFIISELKTAFQIGFMIYIPFIVIDMVVASTLMSMGMMMLPPMMISLPFKVLLFVMVDGWHLVVRSLLLSYGG
ncbi:MAG: flagellar type III secretion system pore protein FliP [bacterium]